MEMSGHNGGVSEIQLQHVTRRFGATTAVDRVSLRAEAGRSHAGIK